MTVSLTVFQNVPDNTSATAGAAAFTFMAYMVAIALIFRAISKRPEYSGLRRNGRLPPFGLFFLLSGFRRAEDDPLRPAHVKLAKIGMALSISQLPAIFVITFVFLI